MKSPASRLWTRLISSVSSDLLEDDTRLLDAQRCTEDSLSSGYEDDLIPALVNPGGVREDRRTATQLPALVVVWRAPAIWREERAIRVARTTRVGLRDLRFTLSTSYSTVP